MMQIEGLKIGVVMCWTDLKLLEANFVICDFGLSK